jgi:hypothetical protein
MNTPLFYTFKDEDMENKKVFSHIYPEIRTLDEQKSYILYKGLKVYPTFMINVISECKIQITWIKARQDIQQGVDASVHNVKLKILDGSNRETKQGFVFGWSGWSSEKTPLFCVPIKFRKKEKQEPKKWFMLNNIWEMKRSDGRIERCSEGGNYGVVIEQKKQNEYRLYFSCGEVDHPNVTFQDLIVDVVIEGEYMPRFQCSTITP